MRRKITRKRTVPRAKKPARRLQAKTAVAAKSRRKRYAPADTPQADAIDSLIGASAQVLELPIDPAWHGGIKFNLQLILRIAALVDKFPLADDTEPGPVFHA
jgi:hypothetical protein